MVTSALLRALPVGEPELRSLAPERAQGAGDPPSIDAVLCESLAREFHFSAPQVEATYREELRRLAFGARITTFLGVLATRSVRARLRR